MDLVQENYDLAFRLVRDESLPMGLDSTTKSQAQKPAVLAANRRRCMAEEQVQALAV